MLNMYAWPHNTQSTMTIHYHLSKGTEHDRCLSIIQYKSSILFSFPAFIQTDNHLTYIGGLSNGIPLEVSKNIQYRTVHHDLHNAAIALQIHCI